MKKNTLATHTGTIFSLVFSITIGLFAGMAFSTAALANPSPFGMTMGELSAHEAVPRYSLQPQGHNIYSGGPMFTAPVAQFQFDGLQDLTLIFDAEKRLAGVIATFRKQDFDRLYSALSNRYTLIDSTIPFVGNKSAEFRDGSTEIHLESPHMSFEMTMSYLDKGLVRAYRKKTREEKERQQRHEQGLL